MTKLEAFDRIKAKALADLAEEQEEFARETGGKNRNDAIDAQMTEVRAATTIGDVLRVMIKRTETPSRQSVQDELTFGTIHNSEDHEMVYLFILQAMGVEHLTHRDLQPPVEEPGSDDGDSE